MSMKRDCFSIFKLPLFSNERGKLYRLLVAFFDAIFVLGFGIIFGVGTLFATPPNIVVVLVDDMGWSDLSCFGNQTVQTPHIDQLAREGISFTQFYVCAPICSPSRCGITTGQYPQRWNITSYLDNRKRNEERSVNQWLDLQAPTLARTLHDAGYATGHFGKWHLGGQRDVGEAPLITEYGFDESLTNFEGLGPRILPLLNSFDGSPAQEYALGSDKLGRGDIRWKDRNRITTGFVEQALAFIRQAEKSDKPFYINLWPDDVHSPFFPAKELRGNGEKKSLYHGVLVEMDLQLAPLFDYIRASETLRNNTLIVFLSDNGPEPGAGSAEPLRGHKGNLYEGGVRSPLIIWGNGLLAPEKIGTKNQTAVLHSLDLTPSLLKMAGIEPNPAIVYDGDDFSHVLLGNKSEQNRNAPIFWRRPPDRPGPKNEPFPDLALRSENWKFLMQFNGSRPQLYDLINDPSESDNLAEQNPEIVERFRKMLRDWNSNVNRSR